MERKQEIEIKLEVRDPKAVKRRLRDFGFRLVKARHFESNRLFDFPDGTLGRARCLLRLRRATGKTIVTFKGAPVRSRRYKVRTEVETEVKDGRRLGEMLETAGLREVFRYDKYRTEYGLGLEGGEGGGQRGSVRRKLGVRGKDARVGKVVYDETPIGNYLELEGPKRWIDRVARQLGFRPKDYITLSYAALYYQKRQEAGKQPQNMVFPTRQHAAGGLVRRRR